MVERTEFFTPEAISLRMMQYGAELARDARQVGELQRALLPASLPRIAGMEIAASYEPFRQIGYIW